MNKDCIRKTENWSYLSKTHKFDKDSFSPEDVLKDMHKASPKLVALLNKIKELDEEDLKKHGKLFKHFVFSDLKYGVGVKIISAAMIASGYKLAINTQLTLLSDETLKKTEGNNFVLLNSTSIYGNDFTVRKKKEILAKFNERPNNTYGELIRIVLLDSGFKEGIDLFDVKYVHVFESQTSTADMKQVIGRATRLCGQKGLEFHPKYGWPLEVFLYNVSLPSSKYDVDSLFKLYVEAAGIDLSKLAFANNLEHYTIVGAVDYELTRNVHKFVTDDEFYNTSWLFGGARSKPTDVICDGKCATRPTKDVPLSIPLFIAVAMVVGKEFQDKKAKPRSYLCDLLKNDKTFCSLAQEAWKDPVQFVKDNKKHIIKAIREGKHVHMPGASRRAFMKFVSDIIDINPSPVNKSVEEESVESSAEQETKSVEKSIEYKSAEQKTKSVERSKSVIDLDDINMSVKSPTKKRSFLETRNYISNNFLQFSWPKVKMENMCIPQGGSEAVTFTPTQDFVRHYFTPECVYKGMLLYHSVGTGKTCTAIATATSAFEKEGYTILWVTRTTLKSDIWKNMFDWVCSSPIREKILNGDDIPKDPNARLRLLSKAWKIRPMSYKQFSNLVSGKNEMYKELVKINGASDPLRKTLLIIDEAHKLYGGADLSGTERPDMNKLHHAIMKSYKTSGDESVRVLLMTATPITNDPMELIKLLNLLRESNSQLPSDYEQFKEAFYVDEKGTFSKRGAFRYLNEIAGYVSYLSRERDARQFAQPVITNITVPISTTDEGSINDLKSTYDKLIDDHQYNLSNKEKDFSVFKNQIAEQKRIAKEKCQNVKPKAQCLERVDEEIKLLNDELFKQKESLDAHKKDIKNIVNDLKKEYKTKLAVSKEDLSQESVLQTKCIKKTKK